MLRPRYVSKINTKTLRNLPKLERYKRLAEISEEMGMSIQREKFARKAFAACVEKDDFKSAVGIIERFSLPEKLLQENHSRDWWVKAFGRGLRKTKPPEMRMAQGSDLFFDHLPLRDALIPFHNEPPFMPQDETFLRPPKPRY